ncbi:glutamate-rich WD repeat-containing protein 1 [Anopheles ziemanni]|uniref:glutamate-rich WD repeat-containing protein 1 n=1 Tax=Anopheles coustani TaxID=139045 RepID=UPI0026595448|nr:glutamate-rich WD repeat-containing protein 1 [Anopheles coustani]XP_058174053.1 glutamate-rich WD repeat-containing protein 1 [Anopheles ziemanni]
MSGANDKREVAEDQNIEDCILAAASDDDMSDEDEAGEEKVKAKVYLPGHNLSPEEELVCDESAYIMLHSAHTGAPCLSFDVVQDPLGEDREDFPMTAFVVSGTQAARTHVNSVIVMKMSNLTRTSKAKSGDDDEDDEDEEDSDDEDVGGMGEDPHLDCALIKHAGCVNRLRVTTFNSIQYVATWSEMGKVHIYNINEQLAAVEDKHACRTYQDNKVGEAIKPDFTFSGHQKEGFAMDWCTTTRGMLATGDCRRDIHIWRPNDKGSWTVDQRPLIGHTDSVEDIQWSPNEPNVLASCSVDKSIRIWDCRAAPSKACMLTAANVHESDVNVISWNRNEPLIASGGDDGVLHIWDLRQFQSKTPVATFKHHTDHITTVEWHPKESTVLASGGDDDQIALWDLSVEKDEDVEDAVTNDDPRLNDLPPQLLFIHQGQKEIKELHWHPQLKGVILSTAHSGFNIFRTISV